MMYLKIQLLFWCLFCNRSWRRKLGRHCCFLILLHRHDVVDVSCSEDPVKSPRGPVPAMLAPAKWNIWFCRYFYYQHPVVFRANCWQHWRQKHAYKTLGKSNIFIPTQGVFLCFHILTKQLRFEFIRYIWYFYIHAAHVFIRYFHLFLSKNCSYPRTHTTLLLVRHQDKPT